MAEPGNNQFVLILLAGTIGMLVMASAIVLFVISYQKRMIREELKRQTLEVEYQKKMLQAVLESQEDERKRVSKDLHDDVGMMLMTIRVQVHALVGKTLSIPLAADIQELVNSTHESIRRISWDLMPTTLERFGLTQTVREMCVRLSGTNAVPVSFVEDGLAGIMDKTQEILLFRIVQESVTNALRHAEAHRVEVRFQWEESCLTIFVGDDGKGFDFTKEVTRSDGQHGLGLMNLENRIGLLGAQLHFEKNNPSGTLVKVKLPLGKPE